jgi:predicted nucleotidyltransferase component of viral defense system
MLYSSAVDPATLALLRELMPLDVFKDVRLVGGTALALQIGHRNSVDLDLFGRLDMEPFELGNPFTGTLSALKIRNSPNIKVYLINNIKVDIVNYGYDWLDKPLLEDGLRLATIKDISAMKLAAITRRGTKKDFIDLSFLLDILSLKEMMRNYLKKYQDGSEFMVLKSLGYFVDAELDEMPFMIKVRSWEEVKSKIVAELKNYVKN